MQTPISHPSLQLNKETIVRFSKPHPALDKAFGKNGVVALSCCGRLTGWSFTKFTNGQPQ